MSENKIIKCGKCGGTVESSSAIKGQNNTYLCGRVWSDKNCGRNVCFICGKKETRTEWRKEEDCCGNEVMRERQVEMFSQKEKDENDPEMELEVYYCDEHKEEGLKSPYKWTEEDSEKQVTKIREKEAQEKWEIEEKLNNQKNFFVVEGRTEENKEGQKYNAFRGKQNGQNYYLMIPFNHPIWKSTDPAVEKVVDDIGWSETGVFLVDGLENIPIEKAPFGYWKMWPKDIVFHKIVGLTNKITFMEAEKQGNPEKNKPVNNKPTDKLANPLPKELNNENLLQYFQKNNIKSIKLDNNELVVKYNNKQQKETKKINDQELEQIKSFVEKLGKRELFLSDLEKISNSTNTPNSNKGIYVGLAVVGVVAVGIISFLLVRKNKTKKH